MIIPNFIITFFIPFSVTLLSILILRPFAKNFGIVDKPSQRKAHIGNIPLVGGIAIFIGIYLSMYSQFTSDFNLFCYFVVGFFILLLGFVDDCYPLSATTKLFLQIIFISFLVWATELKLDTFGHSFGLDTQLRLGIFSYPITVIGIVFVVNAFNLMDGADGVAGSLVIISMIGINIFSIISGQSNLNFLSLAITSSLIPFLYFNLSKSKDKKVFLGDSGSLFLGFSVAFLLLYESQIEKNFSPFFALWLIAIPTFDVISVIIYRFKNSFSLLAPDKSHLHNYFQSVGLSNKLVLIIIIGLSIFCLMLGIFFEYKARLLSFPIFLILLIIYIWLKNFSKYKL